ncbi:hypothetical protein Zmor_001948 [Zophobas morio]|uniref:Uncharacterized protein n=1 Tax=Zophobas morio TaxID=2755281 RepID=A0AA38JAA5_9CUCU|nr:hypothetical protein Zmor_001948 [Zophobas morio]
MISSLTICIVPDRNGNPAALRSIIYSRSRPCAAAARSDPAKGRSFYDPDLLPTKINRFSIKFYQFIRLMQESREKLDVIHLDETTSDEHVGSSRTMRTWKCPGIE